MEDNIEFPPEFDLKSTEYVTHLLPNWKTKIISYEENTSRLTFLVSAKTEADIKNWVKEFEDKHMSSYSIRSTDKSLGRYVLFKQRLNCHHNTPCKRLYDPFTRNRTRNTNCPSSMTITLYPVKKRYRMKDMNKAPNPEMPCKIVLLESHNHSLGSPDLLRFRPVGEDVTNKLLDLYARGYTPATALEVIKIDIHLNFKEDYHKMLADRKFCPDYMYCYHLYKKEFEQQYGPMIFDLKSICFLKEKIDKFNLEASDDNCAKIVFDEDTFIICLCPSLFKKNHRYIKTASELVYMDSLNLNYEGSRLFILLTNSECGGLPLGIIITSSEDTSLISNGLLLLKDMIGDQIFGGNPDGPLVFLTDESTKRMAVQNAFSGTKCLLSGFHVLQAIWRWLSKLKNGIPEEKQYSFYQQFKDIIHARTVSECFEKYNIAISSANNYQNYIEFLEDFWNRKELWAICYRDDLLVRGHYSDNFSEADVRIVNEKIFDRVRAFNVTQMVDFMLTKFVLYYERRLLDAANNCLKDNILGDVITSPPEGVLERIQMISSGITLVPSGTNEDLFYMVHTDILQCSCNDGGSGLYCKHIDWVCVMSYSELYLKNISGTDVQKTFLKIATKEQLPNSCLESLHEENADENNEETNEEIILLVMPPNDNDFEAEDEESSMIERGKNNIKEITDLLTQALEASPYEMEASLEIMKNKICGLSTISEIASAATTFGFEFHEHEKNQVLDQPAKTTKRKRSIGNTSTNDCIGKTRRI